ncbi:SIS domain-containing protein [Clostridiales bacterium COT073_COT-073]|nr:SIS domain-containing protein [Clostridiales bacterium COT073_COT-073]
MNYKNQIENYLKKEKEVFDLLDRDAINQTMNLLIQARDNRRHVFIMGNGGSSATASHYVGDFNKGLSINRDKKYRFICLNDNPSTILSLANDVSYESIFIEQLKNFLDEGDLVICISGSGNSPNIIRAAEYAKQRGNCVIGMTGFDGGRLKTISDVQLHVPVNDMQITEDVHMMFAHLMMSILYNE